MSSLDTKAEVLLELSRLTQEPSAADKARNLAALRERLGLPVPVSAGGSAAAPANGGTAAPANGGTAAPANGGTAAPANGSAAAPANGAAVGVSVALARRAPLYQLVGVGAVTAAIGFFIGLQVERPRPSELPRVADVSSAGSVGDLATRPSAPLPAEARADDALRAPTDTAEGTEQTNTAEDAEQTNTAEGTEQTNTAEPSQASQASRVRPSAPSGEQSAKARALRATASRERPAAAAASRSLAAGATEADADEAAASAAADATSTELAAAVRLLRRARSLVARGEGALALALLDDLDARFPRALLDEEREATRVLALCEAGNIEAARSLAARHTERHPRSIYAPRLAQSCAGAEADPRAPESPGFN